jgi:hypothetical protein
MTFKIHKELRTPYSSDLVVFNSTNTVNVSDQFTYGFKFKTTNINNI